MAELLKKIDGEFLTSVETSIIGFKKITSDIKLDDYIELSGLIAYLQNLSKTELTVKLDKPINFGLLDRYNMGVIELQINY